MNQKLSDKLVDAIIEFDKDENLALIRLTFSKEELVTLLNANEKQIAKNIKVLPWESMDGVPYKTCASCGRLLWASKRAERPKHCPDCGQMNNWEGNK